MIKLSATLLTALIVANVNTATVDLRIMETTDLHNDMMDFDYYKDAAAGKFGLIRMTGLVNDARSEVRNSVLVGNGNLIQGSLLAGYTSAKGLKAGDVHPAYKTLDMLDCTVGALGNHGSNYGLDYLKNALVGVKFPYVSANVIDARTRQSASAPYLIKDIEVIDKDGKEQMLKTSCVGAVPPQVMGRDKANSFEKVTVNDITETTHKYAPEMCEKGVDVVVVLTHPGLSTDLYKVMTGNSVYYLSEIPGVNATMFSYVHVVFPSKGLADIEGVDTAKGTLGGVPAIALGMWGDHFGVVDLQLNNDSGKWQVTQAKAEIRPIYDVVNKESPAVEDSKLVETLKADRDAARQFISKPIGKSTDSMYSYLALMQDGPTVQVMNSAQKAYVEYYIQGDPGPTKLPVLSAAAPFKVNGHKNNPASHMEVERGQSTLRNAASLYLCPSTLVVVEANGKKVKEQSEYSVGQFNQIDPNSMKPRSLINWDGSRTYNFDVIDDMNYRIDVTQPARYDDECQMINVNAEGIKNLTFNGRPADPNAASLAVTSNYRTYDGKSAGTGDNHIASVSSDENRSVLTVWVADESKRAGEIRPAADNSWRLVPIAGDKKLDIRLETSPSDKAAAFIKEKEQYPMNKVVTDNIGLAVYQVDLSKQSTSSSAYKSPAASGTYWRVR